MRVTQVAGATHPGARAANEDAILRLPHVPLFAVADGSGGARGTGEAAANLALATVEERAARIEPWLAAVAAAHSTTDRLGLAHALHELFEAASVAIIGEAGRRHDPVMASTLLLATIASSSAYVAHVGACRAYLARKGRVLRLTEDHSIAELRFRRGRMSQEEYQASPFRQVLYQSLGVPGELEVDVAEVRLVDGDVLILCTDGLVRCLDDDRLAQLVDPTDLARTVQQLLAQAVEAGSPDNLSVIAVGVTAGPDDPPLDDLIQRMAAAPLFSELSATELLLVAPYLEELQVEEGFELAREGEFADAWYLVLAGRLQSRRLGHVEDLGPGANTSALPLAHEGVSESTLLAVEPTHLLTLSRDRFVTLMRHKPELGARVAMALLDELGARTRRMLGRAERIERLLHDDNG